MFKPLHNKVLIKRDPKKETLGELNLAIPKDFQEKEVYGTVVAVGSTADSALQIGQRVLFGKHDGVDIKSEYVGEGGEYIIVRDDQIRAILG